MSIWKCFLLAILGAAAYQALWGLCFSYLFPVLQLDATAFDSLVLAKLVSEVLLYGALAAFFGVRFSHATSYAKVVCGGSFALVCSITLWALATRLVA